MILSTHAVVGAAIASFMPSHPAAAFAAGFASHFLIDAIPHWDYPLRSISAKVGANDVRRITPALVCDLAVIGVDGVLGLALAVALFATPASPAAILAGAIRAMAPDPLQFVHSLFPREPLASLQRFHWWIHLKRKLDWRIGVSSQLAFAVAFALTAKVLHAT